MSGIYLEPESTFSVSVVCESGALFRVVDGSEITLQTLTGRQYHKAMRAIHDRDGDAQYATLEACIVDGIDPKKIGKLHPNVVAILLLETMKRSHLTERDAGN